MNEDEVRVARENQWWHGGDHDDEGWIGVWLSSEDEREW
jgi:hypothetical protein